MQCKNCELFQKCWPSADGKDVRGFCELNGTTVYGNSKCHINPPKTNANLST